jgi:glycerophosphoryl diester phosphodiesterase
MVRIIGHRGARNLWPENSIDGFRRLIELGVDGVEFDVHPTRDGGIVVIHDPTLERTAEGEGPVSEKTTAELKAIRLRGSSEGIPTLEEVLTVLRDSSLELHIEIKTDPMGNPYRGFEEKVIRTVDRLALQDHTILTCFVPEVLETVRSLRPDMGVLASLDRRSAERMGGVAQALARLDAIPGCLVAVEKALLTETLELCMATLGGDRLGAWVPNEEADLSHWLQQPIRQITSDRPDLALEIRYARLS